MAQVAFHRMVNNTRFSVLDICDLLFFQVRIIRRITMNGMISKEESPWKGGDAE